MQASPRASNGLSSRAVYLLAWPMIRNALTRLAWRWLGTQQNESWLVRDNSYLYQPSVLHTESLSSFGDQYYESDWIHRRSRLRLCYIQGPSHTANPQEVASGTTQCKWDFCFPVYWAAAVAPNPHIRSHFFHSSLGLHNSRPQGLVGSATSWARFFFSKRTLAGCPFPLLAIKPKSNTL